MITEQDYNRMVEDCKRIAVDFKKTLKQSSENLDTTNENYLDEFGVSEEEIYTLFERLKNAMGVKSKLCFFRDNDEEHGRYNESTDTILLPCCICYYLVEDIVKHMAHELYHAFQYNVICKPEYYSYIDSETIKRWDYEFKHYVSGTKDMQQYLDQEIEKTARNFARLIAEAK